MFTTDNRPSLHAAFESILGSHNVYFQPPASVRMSYPAIVYSRRTIEKTYANGIGYITAPSYEVTLIDSNPDSQYVERILALPYCSFDRHYEADRLNHDVFTIYDN